MYSPIHASAGLLLAQLTSNPIAALGIGIVSHYILDAIPHGDTRPLRFFRGWSQLRVAVTTETVDLPATIFTVAYLFGQLRDGDAALLAGAFGGLLPDILWGLKLVLQRVAIQLSPLTWILTQHNRWHEFIHAKRHYDLPHRFGIAYQAVLLAGLFGYYYFR